MTRKEAQQLRRDILGSAEHQPDGEALNRKWMYGGWRTVFPYMIGDRVRDGDKLYKCIQAHISQADWAPDVTPALWVEVSVEEWPEWRRPTGAHDAYNIGDKCSYKEKHWINTADANVYPPDVYGWEEAT